MTYAQGTDISHHNDFKPGKDFTFHKATQGPDYIDPAFAERWKLLAGKVRGAYCWLDPGDSTAQVAHFLAVVKPIPSDLLILDYEATGINHGEARDWFIAVHKAAPANKLVCYGHPDDVGVIIALCKAAGVTVYGWVAKWSTVEPSGPWTFWQFGSIGVDADKFNGTAAELAAWTGGTMPPDTETTIEQSVAIGERMAMENYVQKAHPEFSLAGTGIPKDGWTIDNTTKYGVHAGIGFLCKTDELAAMGSSGGGAFPEHGSADFKVTW